MKAKRLFAIILATAMLLGMMSFPAFADTTITYVNDYTEFKTAIQNQAEYIKFKNNIICDSTQVSGMIADITHPCTIDLDIYTLDMTANTGSFYTKANVTVTGVKDRAAVTFSQTSTDVFRCLAGALTLENLTFSGKTACYVVSAQESGKTVNVINCTLTDILPIDDDEPNIFSTVSNAVFHVTNSTIDAGSGRAFLSGTVYLNGQTSVTGAKKNTSAFYVIGNDVQFNGTTGTVSSPVTSVTAASGDTTYYETFADALRNAGDGATIKLLTDCEVAQGDIECPTTESRTIDLNGKTLKFTDSFVAFRGNWTITGDADRKSKLQLTGNGDSAGSLLSVGYYDANNSTLTVSNATIDAPEFYSSGCGLIGAYCGSTIDFTNVTVNDTENTESNPNACKTIFYGQAISENCTINLTNVKISNIEAEKVIGNCANVNIDGLTFSGKVSEYALQVLGNATIKNSTFTFDANSSAINALYRDAGFETDVTFENTQFNGVPECTDGIFAVSNSASAITGDANTAVNSVTDQIAFAAKVTKANGAELQYPSLADAISNAADGDTVTLLSAMKGDGIAILANTFPTDGLTIDLGGNTYTVDGNLKGSDGSESNGFYLERGNKITIQNGKITSGKNAKYYSTNDQCYYNAGILVQNHTEALTLNNVTLDGENLRDEKFSYTLGNNNGTVTIINSKIIANADGTNAIAFDADKSVSSYAFNSVTVDANSTITGYMEITAGGTINYCGNTYTANGIYYKQGNQLVSVAGAETGRIIKAEATQSEVKAGDEFEVKVLLNADEIATAGFKMTYDTSLFTLIDDEEANDGEIDFFDNAGAGRTYTNGDALATYKFKALAQSEAKTGNFVLTNTRAYTYEENRLGLTFEVKKQDASVEIALNSFTAKVKLDGTEVSGNSATLNYDGKSHSVVIDVQPQDYKRIDKTFKVNGQTKYGEPDFKEPGTYEIAYTVVSHDGYGECTGTFTLEILAPNAYYVEVNTKASKTADYVAGKKLVLVYTDLNNVAFRYNGNDMIEVTKAIGNYKYNGTETTQTVFSHVYAYVADKTADNTFGSYQGNVTPFIVEDGYKIEKIDKYTCDINNKVGIDEQDPGTAIGVYGVASVYYSNPEAQKNILKADVNGDKCVTQEDIVAVTLAKFGK